MKKYDRYYVDSWNKLLVLEYVSNVLLFACSLILKLYYDHYDTTKTFLSAKGQALYFSCLVFMIYYVILYYKNYKRLIKMFQFKGSRIKFLIGLFPSIAAIIGYILISILL